MKKLNLLFLAVIFMGFSSKTYAQEDDPKGAVNDVFNQSTSTSDALKTLKTDSLKHWKINGAVGLNSSATMLSNWAAGGSNSASFIGFGNVRLLYQKNKFAWDNFFDTEFGYTYISKTKYDWRKSNDKINFNTKAGYNIGKKFYLTILGSFRSQYAKGFDYSTENKKTYISNWLSPSYTDISLGLDWKPNNIFSIYLSPAAGRITTCIDTTRYPVNMRTMYGIDTTKSFKLEFGAMFKGAVNYKYKSFKVTSFLTLFTPYTKRFGNVDVDWDVAISYQLLKVLNVSLGTTMKYYDAIKFDTGDGKGAVQHVQFKAVLGIGVGYTF